MHAVTHTKHKRRDARNGPRLSFTEQQIAAALRRNSGLYSHAAKSLGCQVQTIMNYVRRYPNLRLIEQEAREGCIDLAESNLLKLIKAKNPNAIFFYLKTQGKHRGYGERDNSVSFDTFHRIVSQMAQVVLKYVQDAAMIEAINNDWAAIPLTGVGADHERVTGRRAILQNVTS